MELKILRTANKERYFEKRHVENDDDKDSPSDGVDVDSDEEIL